MERSLIVTTALVPPIMEGLKTETRRVSGLSVLNKDPSKYEFIRFAGLDKLGRLIAVFKVKGPHRERNFFCPYGTVGDRLWVRENFTYMENIYYYMAGEGTTNVKKWTPSIHMPRKASRLTLEITEIKLERLHAISEEDAKAEGVAPIGQSDSKYRDGFMGVWIALNGLESWQLNPWVWVIKFNRCG